MRDGGESCRRFSRFFPPLNFAPSVRELSGDPRISTRTTNTTTVSTRSRSLLGPPHTDPLPPPPSFNFAQPRPALRRRQPLHSHHTFFLHTLSLTPSTPSASSNPSRSKWRGLSRRRSTSVRSTAVKGRRRVLVRPLDTRTRTRLDGATGKSNDIDLFFPFFLFPSLAPFLYSGRLQPPRPRPERPASPTACASRASLLHLNLFDAFLAPFLSSTPFHHCPVLSTLTPQQAGNRRSS